MTPIERAERAQQLLEDPVLRDAFHDIREKLVLKLETAPIGEVQTHHEVTLTLQCLKQLQLQLSAYTNEIAVDKFKQKQDEFLRRTKQTTGA